MNNTRLKRLIIQSLSYFKLDLSGLNVLLPCLKNDDSILPVLAALSNAENIYVLSSNVLTMNRTMVLLEEFGMDKKIHFISRENDEILSEIDILILGEGVSDVNADYLEKLNKKCVISILPPNLDFFTIKGIHLKESACYGIPVICLNPGDYGLMLYRYFAHKIIHLCYQANLEVYRSRLLLIGNGEMLDNTVSLLKSAGAQVFAYNTIKNKNNDYIIKHLPEIDGVVVMDYPLTEEQVIGKNGLITVDDLLEHNPEISIINFAGNIDYRALVVANIDIVPHHHNKNSNSITTEEFGQRVIVETCAAVLKVAESYIKMRNKSVQYQNSVIKFDVVNAENSMILGKVLC